MSSAVPFFVFVFVVVVMVGAGLLFNMSLYARGAIGSRRLATVPATKGAADDQVAMSLGAPTSSTVGSVRRMLYAVAAILVAFGLLLSTMLAGRF